MKPYRKASRVEEAMMEAEHRRRMAKLQRRQAEMAERRPTAALPWTVYDTQNDIAAEGQRAAIVHANRPA